MLRELPKNIKIAVVVGVVLVLALVGYGIYLSRVNIGKIAITITVAPDNATVTLNGKVASPGTAYVEPNTPYDITINKDGFSSFSGKQRFDDTNNTIVIALNAQSKYAIQWAKDHQDQYLAIEALSGDQANKKGESFTAKNPITSQLPFENLIYSIGYMLDQSDPSGNTIVLTIDASEGTRNGAVQAIKDMGYNPANFKIKFTDYESPFTS